MKSKKLIHRLNEGFDQVLGEYDTNLEEARIVRDSDSRFAQPVGIQMELDDYGKNGDVKNSVKSKSVQEIETNFRDLPKEDPTPEMSPKELLDADTQAMDDYQRNKKPYTQLSFMDAFDELEESYMTEEINWDRMLITKCAKGAAWAKGMKLCNYNDIYEVVEFTDHGNVYVDMCKKDTDDPYVADACPEFTEEEFADYLRVYNKMFGDEE